MTDTLQAELPATLALLDGAPVLVFGADEDGRIAVFNRACEALTGYGRDDVLGRPLVDVLVPAQWRERVRRRFEDASSQALAAPHRSPWRTKDGGERLIEWRCFTGMVGEARCLLGLGSDVTEISRAERRVAVQQLVTRILGESRSVEEAASSILTALCAGLDFDAGGLWTADDAGLLRCRDFVSRGDVDAVALETLSRSLVLGAGEGLPGRVWTTGKTIWIGNLATDQHFLRREATQAGGLTSALAFPVAGHDFTGVVEFFARERREPDAELVDVLESIATQMTGFVARVRAEEQTRQAQRLAEHESRIKDDLLGRISHELRNPLAAIQGWLDVLTRRAMDDVSRARALDVARRNTALLRLLADDLVDAARIGRGGALTMAPERVDVAEIVRDVVTESTAAATNGTRISLDIAPGDARIHGDPLRLRQVFGNLLSNALKFTAHTVAVRLAVDGGMVTVQVIDDGVGMSRDQLGHVFESYWQARARGGGLGLGLTIARHIVDAHGGVLEASSGGPGQGSTFAVRLPCTRPGAG